MMRMTLQVYMQNLWKSWHDKIWGICHRGGNKRGATTTNPKMMPCNISVSEARGDTGAKGSVTGACHARWWGDPGCRVPTGGRHGNEEEHASDNFEHGANAGISCIANIRSRKVISAVIPLKRAFSEQIQFVEGSSGTRAVVEVVVLVMVVKVVVHDDRWGTRDLRDGNPSQRLWPMVLWQR